MKRELLEKYARLLVKIGINIQRDQLLVINTPIECAEFARLIAETAYQEGARDVIMNWRDEKFSKLRYMNAPEEVFLEYPEWQRQFYVDNARKGAAFLSIAASDPDLMKGVDPERIMKTQRTAGTAILEYRERLMKNQNVWCVASVPTEAWAKRVFPELEKDAAIERLWEMIFSTVRVDTEDPVAEWEKHKATLKTHMDFMNQSQFKYLRYRNSAGTDLVIELPENHIWAGGADFSEGGVEFIANMPTEEIFTMPKKDGVNGRVVATKPFNCNGNLVENFSMEFKDGKVVAFTADKGYETLKGLLSTDEGAGRLGEVALVPYDSPISNTNILFYNTLFDENASCHLAVGKAYPICIKGGNSMDQAALAAAGVNDSLIHEDFMIGSKDLSIIGVHQDGTEVVIFDQGNFAF